MSESIKPAQEYEKHLAGLEILEKTLYDTGLTYIMYKSPLTAQIGVEQAGKILRMRGHATNPRKFAWFSPFDTYFVNGAYKIFDDKENLVVSEPVFKSIGRISLTDSMFRNIEPGEVRDFGQDFDLEKIAQHGNGRYCGQFSRNTMLPSIRDSYGSEKKLDVQTLMMSNRMCFDLVKDASGIKLSNIHSEPANWPEPKITP